MNFIIALLYVLIVIGNVVIFVLHAIKKLWRNVTRIVTRFANQKIIRRLLRVAKIICRQLFLVIRQCSIILFLIPQKLMHGIEWILAVIVFSLLSAGIFVMLALKKFKIPKFTLPQKKHPKRVKKKTGLRIFTKIKYFSLGILFSLVFIFLPLLSVVFLQELPDPNILRTEQLPQTTKIYDRNHTLLYEMYANQNRTMIKLSDIPLFLQQATIAIEDKNFYKNPGVDVAAIIRAAIADISGKDLQGGSTITQQLIKSSLLTPQRSINRKIQEIILAFWAEKIYTKDQILQMYFNQVPYGGIAWGVEAASETYFGQHVNELDLAQCAFLAGLPQAPTTYSPYNSTAWKDRQKEVLQRMLELGYISKQQEQAAITEELHFQKPEIPLLAPHFTLYVRDLLIQKYGLETVEKGGLTVITSLDLSLQNMTQNIVTNEINKDGYLLVGNGAALITNPSNGDILAMIGSKEYNDPNGGNNNLTTSLRQPGSSIKLVTYAAALSHGMTAATSIDDAPTTFPGNPPYSPVNYDGRFHGRVTLRTALANSFNIPAVKTLQQVGLPTFLDLAKQMGISSFTDTNNYGLAITLGGADATMLDMATAYGTVANQGKEVDLNPILKVTDANGHVLEEKQIDAKQVLDPGVTFILSDILADNNARSLEFGINSPLYIPNHYIPVKTGTSDDKRDNWTFGFTKNYVVSVWVGNNDNSPMSQTLASGITGAAPIWHDIMTNLVQHEAYETPSVPSDVVQKQCFGKNEYFLSGTENSVSCIPMTPTPTIVAGQIIPQPVQVQAIHILPQAIQEPRILRVRMR